MARKISVVGDVIFQGVNPILEGNPVYRVNGMPVDLKGYITACGCSLDGSPSATQPCISPQSAVQTPGKTAHAVN